MVVRLAVGLGIYKAAIVGLFQSDIISDSVLDTLNQYPPLAVVLIVVYYMQRTQKEENKERRRRQKEDNEQTRQWLDEMLKNQRLSLKEIYEGNQSFLFSQIEANQNKTSGQLDNLASQLAINNATVGEIARVDSIVNELIARLEKK